MTEDEIRAIAKVRVEKRHKKFRYTMNILIFLVMPILIAWRMIVQFESGIEGEFLGFSGDVFALILATTGLLAVRTVKLYFATEIEEERLIKREGKIKN